jgi:hypothetical protein
MPTADISPHAVEVGAQQKKNRYAAFFNAFLTISFALLAGMKADRGIQDFRAGQSDWQLDALMGLFCLLFAIVWVSRLRVKWGVDA